MPSTTITARLTAVTKVQSGSPSRPHSAASQGQFTLRSGAHYGLLQFGLPRDLSNATVLSAKLRVRGTAAWSGSSTITAQLLAGPIRSTTTWNNQPGLLADSDPHSGGLMAGSTVWYEVDVTDDLQQVATGAPYFGHRLTINDATARAFYSRTNSSSYPQLVITYATETPAPVGVKPSGVVAVQSPTFTWLAPSDVTKVQAQADVGGGSFAAPLWESAEIVSKLGQVNTAAAGWAGLADGGEAALRFRQYGSLGWSAWSLPVTVERDAYASVQVVFPVPNGVTNDPTPPHRWVFPGQSKFQLLILDAAGKVLYDSGQVAGDDQEWTPVLTTVGVRSGAVLTSRLRVWDDVAGRVASTGDPGFVETSWSWTLNQTTDTPTPQAFSALVQAERPVPVLSWSWAGAAPDEFVLEENGVLTQRFDAADLTLVGTRYSVEDWTCPPNTGVRYAVRAINGAKMSPASNAQWVHHELGGVVIAEPESGAWLNVAEASAADGLGQVETTLSYKGPYAQGSVKRVLALGGIEGAVAGVLHPMGDRPMEEQLADAATIRSLPTRECRLVYGFVNVPVQVSALDVTLSADALFKDMTHRIKFEVDQVGEFDTDATGVDTPVGG